jgi:murein endopeptidase
MERGIEWRSSTAQGSTGAGALVDGVKLSREGVHFITWDPVEWRRPNPPSRRHGTDRLIRVILEVARAHRRGHRRAPRVTVGDISRPQGGSFDARYGTLAEFGRGEGTLGHVSHQNGLDVDIYYPRGDGRERAPDSLEDIDLRLAQDLVDRFVAAGAQYVFVGPRTSLTGPAGIVQPLERHDDHMHVRLPPG